MFEFHGWANIKADDSDDTDWLTLERRLEKIVSGFKDEISKIQDSGSIFEVRPSSNALIVFLTHGLRNHGNPDALELFEWLAKNAPDSYGLLYCWDSDHNNEFIVYRLSQGNLSEMKDIYLSPCIPTIEKPFEF
jgi:Immunity protein 7